MSRYSLESEMDAWCDRGVGLALSVLGQAHEIGLWLEAIVILAEQRDEAKGKG